MLKLLTKNREKIRYIVKGKPGTFRLTYKFDDDHPTQQVVAKNNWSRSFRLNSKYYYISVQAVSRDAEIHVKVLRNGKLLNRAVNNGDYAVLTLSGSTKGIFAN
jgi:hypothetical protein